MSVEPSKPKSCSQSVQSVFSDLRGAHDEFGNVFGEMFDQLESMSLELFARHKCLELSTQQQAEHETANNEHGRQFHECLEELRGLEAKVCSAHEEAERVWSEISATHQKFLQEHAGLDEIQEEIRGVSTEFRTMLQDVEKDRVETRQLQESIQEHVQQLARVSAEAMATQSVSSHDEQLSQIVETIRQQQAAWQQDRVLLESELETERQRAAQQNEAFVEQRGLVAQQQAELDGELKRMRSLLEILLNNMNQPFGTNTDHADQTASCPENAALESMLAQFEMLQRDLAQRRESRYKDAAKR